MTAIQKIAVSERTAAKMLDLQLCDFRELVEAGALPPPIQLHELKRWRVADLDAILTGETMSEEFEV